MGILTNTVSNQSRIKSLEDKRVRTTRFATISSGTSGSVTLPTNAVVVLDDFGGTTDAVISTMSGGRPTFTGATTAGFVAVGTTFDSSGNYVLTGTPSSYPVAIVYRVYQSLVDFDSTSSDIIGSPHISGGGAAPDTASFVTIAAESTLSNERVLTGTSNQVIVTDNGPDTTVTLSTPQNIHTAATPTFGGLILTGGATMTTANVSSYIDYVAASEPSAPANGIRAYGLNIGVNDSFKLEDQNGNKFTALQDTVYDVRNTSGSAIAKLTPLRFTGSFFTVSGQPVPVVQAIGASKTTIAHVVALTSIGANSYGRGMSKGIITSCDTSGTPYGETWAAGDFIYLSTTSGYLTRTLPTAPTPVQRIGMVFSANATTGVFFVNIQNITGYDTGTASNNWSIGDDSTDSAKQITFNGLTGDLTISWTPSATWTMTVPQSAGNDTLALTNFAQTFLNKTLSNGIVIYTGNRTTFEDPSDTTKGLQFNLAAISGSTTRSNTWPDYSGTVILDSYSDTTSNAKAIRFSSTSNSTNTALTIATAQSSAQTLSVPNITASDTFAVLGLTQTFSQANIFSYGSTASIAAVKLSGAPYTAGSATTNKPLFLIENAASSNAWSTAGTIIGANPATGFSGSLLDLQVNASSKFKVDYAGAVTAGTYNTATIPTTADTVVCRATTDTLTNKRVTLRVITGSTGATITATADTADIYKQTINGNVTIAAPTGTPIDGDLLEIIIIQDATGSRTYSWNSIFVWTTDITVVGTGSGPNKKDRFLWQSDSGATKWCIVARNLGQ